jgi:tetratricopeptide (TPR) repeat protein
MTARRALVAAALGIAIASWSPARAQSPEQTFEAACHAYDQGRWDEAAEGFRSLLRFRFADWRLEYNLANTEYKRGRLGEAILHYERAHRLQPSDADVVANLAIARGKIRDVVEVDDPPGLLSAFRSVQDGVGVEAQALMALAGVWVVAAIVTWCASRVHGFTPGWCWALAAAILATGLVALSWRASWARLQGTPRAVILKPSIEALAGPALNNASMFTLHEGTTVTIESEREGWLQIALPNGLTGWVEQDAAERI